MESSRGVLEGEPREVNLLDLMRERKEEISDLLTAIEGCSHDAVAADSSRKKTHIQRLPRHMRRRAMSHNVKRIPRRLRVLAADSVAATNHRKKPPSRKYRRKPANLLTDYIRRQRVGPKWLETHIWHAKRFHMDNRWGYKIPITSTQRGFRAVHRDITKRAVVFDLSYYSIVELCGSEVDLLAGLKRLGSPGMGLTFAAVAYLDGKRAGETLIYSRDSYPLKAICPVKFIWKPKLNGVDVRTIWIIVHPAASAQVKVELTAVFSLAELSTADEVITTKVKTLSQFYSLEPSGSKVLRNELSNVQLTTLDRQLNYFRLVGPAATRILHECLKVSRREDISHLLSGDTTSSYWWSEYFRIEENLDKFRSEDQFWQGANSCDSARTNLFDGTVVSLTIRDPRIQLVGGRAKLSENQQLQGNGNHVPQVTTPFGGPIWDNKIRNSALMTQLPESKLQERQRESLGSDAATLKLGDSLIPLMMIFNRGTGDDRRTLAIGAGWDLIIPGGWGKAFWLLLQYYTVRAVGLKDFERLDQEMNRLNYPQHWPDTEGGKISAEAMHKEKLSSWLRKPPNKRVDYRNLKITSPFIFNWKLLVGEWMSSGEQPDYFVLREKWILRELETLCKGSRKPNVQSAKSFFDSRNFDELHCCLVPVEIVSSSKGIPKPLSIICLPFGSDLQTLSVPAHLRRVAQQGSMGESVITDESSKTTKCQTKLVQLAAEKSVETTSKSSLPEFLSFSTSLTTGSDEIEVAIEDLFRDRKLEKVEKRKAKEKLKAKVKKLKKGEVKGQSAEAAEQPEGIRHSCCRPVIGSVCAGDFSFGLAKGRAVGYVTFLGLRQLLLEKEGRIGAKVLYRNTTSRGYRLAHLSVLTMLKMAHPVSNGVSSENHRKIIKLLETIAKGRETSSTIKELRKYELINYDPSATGTPPSVPEAVANCLRQKFAALIGECGGNLDNGNAEVVEGSLMVLGLLGRLPGMSISARDEGIKLLSSLIKCVSQNKEKGVTIRSLWFLWKEEILSIESIVAQMPLILDAITIHCGTLENLTALGSKPQLCLMITNVLRRFVKRFPEEMHRLAVKWIPQLLRLGLHQTVSVNVAALQLLNETVDNQKNFELSPTMRNEVKSSFAKRLVTLFSSHSQLHALKYWNVLVKVLGKNIHEGASLLNAILPVVESGFREKTDQSVRTQAFICWQSLIENFSLDPDVLCHNKRLGLILQPLKTTTHVESCEEPKFITWWTLAVELKNRLETHFDVVFVPMIKFCVGGDIECLSSTDEHINQKFRSPVIVAGRPKLLMLDQSPPDTPYAAVPSVQKYLGEVMLNVFCDSTQNYNLDVAFKGRLKPLSVAVINLESVWKRHAHLFLQCLRIWGLLACERESEMVCTWSSTCWKSLWEHLGNSERQPDASMLENVVIQFGRFLDEVNIADERKLELLADFSKLKLPKDKCVDSSEPGESSFALITTSRGLNILANLMEFKTISLSERQSMGTVWENACKAAFVGETTTYSFPVALKMLELVSDTTSVFHTAGQSDFLLELWNGFAEHLGKYLLKVNVVSQGGDWEWIFSALTFPLSHLCSDGKALGMKSFTEHWKVLYAQACRCVELEISTAVNSFCEGFCAHLLRTADLTKPPVRSMVSMFIMTVIDQTIFTDGTNVFQFQERKNKKGEKERKFDTLGNLNSLVQLTTQSLQKSIESQYQTEDDEKLLMCVQLLFSKMLDSGAMAGLMETVCPVLAVVFEKCKEKQFTNRYVKKVEACWNVIRTSVPKVYSGPYDSEMLKIWFPVLQLALVHHRNPIQSEGFTFWLETFAKSGSLTYTADMREFFLRLKRKSSIICPGLVDEEVRHEYAPALQSQTSLPSLDQKDDNALNVPVVGQSPQAKSFESLMAKEQSAATAGVAASPVSATPKVPPLKLSLTESPVSGNTGKKKKRTRLSDVQDGDFVAIPSSPKQKKMVLTEHQQEVMKQQRDSAVLNTGSLNADSQPLPEMFTTASQMAPDNFFESFAMADKLEGPKKDNKQMEQRGSGDVLESEDEEENQVVGGSNPLLPEEPAGRPGDIRSAAATDWPEKRKSFQDATKKINDGEPQGIIDLTEQSESDTSAERPAKRSHIEASVDKLKTPKAKRSEDKSPLSKRKERLMRTSTIFREKSPPEMQSAFVQQNMAKRTGKRGRGKSVDSSSQPQGIHSPSTSKIDERGSAADSGKFSPPLSSFRKSLSGPASSTDISTFSLTKIALEDVNRLVDSVDVEQENDQPEVKEPVVRKRRRRTDGGSSAAEQPTPVDQATPKKRRGRPPGSYVGPDGKLVYPSAMPTTPVSRPSVPDVSTLSTASGKSTEAEANGVSSEVKVEEKQKKNAVEDRQVEQSVQEATSNESLLDSLIEGTRTTEVVSSDHKPVESVSPPTEPPVQHEFPAEMLTAESTPLDRQTSDEDQQVGEKPMEATMEVPLLECITGSEVEDGELREPQYSPVIPAISPIDMPQLSIQQPPGASSGLGGICASPSGSILKKKDRKRMDDQSQAESPSSKRVSFAPSAVAEEVGETVPPTTPARPRKKKRVAQDQQFSLIPTTGPPKPIGILQMASPRTQHMIRAVQEKEKAKKVELSAHEDVHPVEQGDAIEVLPEQSAGQLEPPSEEPPQHVIETDMTVSMDEPQSVVDMPSASSVDMPTASSETEESSVEMDSAPLVISDVSVNNEEVLAESATVEEDLLGVESAAVADFGAEEFNGHPDEITMGEAERLSSSNSSLAEETSWLNPDSNEPTGGIQYAVDTVTDTVNQEAVDKLLEELSSLGNSTTESEEPHEQIFSRTNSQAVESPISNNFPDIVVVNTTEQIYCPTVDDLSPEESFVSADQSAPPEQLEFPGEKVVETPAPQEPTYPQEEFQPEPIEESSTQPANVSFEGEAAEVVVEAKESSMGSADVFAQLTKVLSDNNLVSDSTLGDLSMAAICEIGENLSTSLALVMTVVKKKSA